MATSAMETVGILSLPDELLWNISRYLSMSDILSCSMSCHRLRSALNDNAVWKGFLHSEDLTVSEGKELLTIDIPLHKNLSPLCKNRLHLIRKVKILNNWSHGRCSSQVIQESYGDITEGKRKLSSHMSMYSDSFLFLVNKFEKFKFVELWDIKGKPILLTHIKYQSVDKVIVVGDNLLIFDKCCRIYVHDICIKDNALPLKYVLQKNDEDICLSSSGNECSHEIKEFNCSGFRQHNVYKHFLVSCIKNKVFIWDFEKSKNIVTYNFPHASRLSVEVNNSYGSYVLLRFHPFDVYHVKIINIFQEQSLDLTHLRIYNDHIVLKDSYFVAIEESMEFCSCEIDCSFSVYNMKTNQLMSQKLFKVNGNDCEVRDFKILNGYFAIPDLRYEPALLVDAETLDIIHKIEHPYKYEPIYHFNVLHRTFVGNTDCMLKIWNLERKVLLSSLPFLDVEDSNNYLLTICFNKLSSKVVCFHPEIGTISVFNFLN